MHPSGGALGELASAPLGRHTGKCGARSALMSIFRQSKVVEAPIMRPCLYGSQTNVSRLSSQTFLAGLFGVVGVQQSVRKKMHDSPSRSIDAAAVLWHEQKHQDHRGARSVACGNEADVLQMICARSHLEEDTMLRANHPADRCILWKVCCGARFTRGSTGCETYVLPSFPTASLRLSSCWCAETGNTRQSPCCMPLRSSRCRASR